MSGLGKLHDSVSLDATVRFGEGFLMRVAAERGGSVCLNTVRVVSKWIGRSFQSAAGIGVARLMYA